MDFLFNIFANFLAFLGIFFSDFFLIHWYFWVKFLWILVFADLFNFMNFAIPIFWFSFFSLLLFDFLSYFLWILLWYIKFFQKYSYDNEKLFFLYFRFIPIVWAFWVFIWAFLKSKGEFSWDFLKIFFWNILFMIFQVIYAYLIIFFFDKILWIDISSNIFY